MRGPGTVRFAAGVTGHPGRHGAGAALPGNLCGTWGAGTAGAAAEERRRLRGGAAKGGGGALRAGPSPQHGVRAGSGGGPGQWGQGRNRRRCPSFRLTSRSWSGHSRWQRSGRRRRSSTWGIRSAGHRAATRLAEREALYWLGLGWMLEQGSPFAAAVDAPFLEPPRRVPAADWREQSLAAYRRAYSLSLDRDLKAQGFAPGADTAISLEAGEGILRLLKGRALTAAQRAEVARVQQSVKTLQDKPRAITPNPLPAGAPGAARRPAAPGPHRPLRPGRRRPSGAVALGRAPGRIPGLGPGTDGSDPLGAPALRLRHLVDVLAGRVRAAGRAGR